MKKFIIPMFLTVGIANADLIPVLVTTGVASCAVCTEGRGGSVDCTDYSVAMHDSGGVLTADQPAYPEFFTIHDFSAVTGRTETPDHIWVQNVARTDFPAPVLPFADEAVPEPETLGVVGVALLALGLLCRNAAEISWISRSASISSPYAKRKTPAETTPQ